MTFGGLVTTWAEDRAGLRWGIDAFATYLDAGEDDPWGVLKTLLYLSAFDREVGWSASAGLYMYGKPATERIGGEVVLSEDAEGRRTVLDRLAGFVHGTLPWAGITAGLLIDEDGVRQLKALGNVVSAEIWESVGPHIAAFPQLGNWQLGGLSIRKTRSADLKAMRNTSTSSNLNSRVVWGLADPLNRYRCWLGSL